MRRHETTKDYKTLTDRAVNLEMFDNLTALSIYLSKKVKEKTLLRSESVKVSVSLNNLLKDLGL